MSLNSVDVSNEYLRQQKILQEKLAKQLQIIMSNLLNNGEKTADIAFVFSGGNRLYAHTCILRQRAPEFFHRYIEQNLSNEIMNNKEGRTSEIFIKDNDFTTFNILIRSIYDDDGREVVPNMSLTEQNSNEVNQNKIKLTHEKDILEDNLKSRCFSPSPIDLTGSKDFQKRKNCNSAGMTTFGELANEDQNQTEQDRPTRSGCKDSEKRLPLQNNSEDQATEMKSIFSMFVPFNTDDGISQSFPTYEHQHKSLSHRKVSYSSLSSLNFMDTILPNESEQKPISQLSRDLLAMYLNSYNEDSYTDYDVLIKAKDGELKAHWAILWANSPFFRRIYESSTGLPKTVKLEDFSETSLHFLFSFMYGRITEIPRKSLGKLWEIVHLAELVNVDGFIETIQLHIRAFVFHFFHKPCSVCSNKAAKMMVQVKKFESLQILYKEAVLWQAKYFPHIWTSQGFQSLHEQQQRIHFDDLISSVGDGSALKMLIACEEFIPCSSKIVNEHLSVTMLKTISTIKEECKKHLISSYDKILSQLIEEVEISSPKFVLYEQTLVPFIHALTPNMIIRTFICLKYILKQLECSNPLIVDELQFTNLRHLCNRLRELVDKHMLHYSPSIISATEWSMLDVEDQNRIKNYGIFVDFCAAKSLPPKLSSSERKTKSVSGKRDAKGIDTIQQSTALANKMDLTYKAHNSNIATDMNSQIVHEIENNDQELSTLSKKRKQIPTSSQTGKIPGGIKETRQKKSSDQAKKDENETFERQNTHTIMTIDNNVKVGSAKMFDDTSKRIWISKPRSIVKPIQRNRPSVALENALNKSKKMDGPAPKFRTKI